MVERGSRVRERWLSDAIIAGFVAVFVVVAPPPLAVVGLDPLLLPLSAVLVPPAALRYRRRPQLRMQYASISNRGRSMPLPPKP